MKEITHHAFFVMWPWDVVIVMASVSRLYWRLAFASTSTLSELEVMPLSSGRSPFLTHTAAPRWKWWFGRGLARSERTHTTLQGSSSAFDVFDYDYDL